jgi:DNA-binding winged helix-turn-helix (wHTH) protein
MQSCFSGYRLDPKSRQLFQADRPVHLTPKAFELLKTLIENRPRAVSRAELVQRTWPGTYVSDASLPRVIAEVRNALGDDAYHPRLIRTVHAFGYAFAGSVAELPEPAERRGTAGLDSYWIVYGSRDFPLSTGENLIGRDPAATVRLASPLVSRRHARIVIGAGDATVEDLGSRNGTYLHGEKLDAPASLEDGDRITLASFRVTFRALRATDMTETQA